MVSKQAQALGLGVGSCGCGGGDARRRVPPHPLRLWEALDRTVPQLLFVSL